MATIYEKVIYFDSRDADVYYFTKLMPDGTSKDLTSAVGFTLVEKIEVPENMDIKVSLDNATIPYSFYNIRNDVNNRINYRVWEIDGNGFIENPGSANLTIPEGNYSTLSLAQYLSSAIDNKNGTENPLSPAENNYQFDFTQNFNSDLQKFEYGIVSTGATAAAGKTLEFQFLIDDGNDDTMIVELGFNPIDPFFRFRGPPLPFTNLSPNSTRIIVLVLVSPNNHELA